MKCLVNERLVELALADASGRDPERRHIAACPRCAGRLKEVAEQLGRVESAMSCFNRDHASERERLLAALATVEKPGPKRSAFVTLKEVMTMPRTWIGSAVAAALLVGAVFFWHGGGTPSLLAQTAQALREVKSLRCQVSNEMTTPDGAKHADTGTW